MQRCDFASVMAVIRSDLMDGSFDNQIDLAETLFSAYISAGAGDIFFDASQANKWFNGLLKPSPAICQFYAANAKNQAELAITLEDSILPCLSDSAMVMQRIYELLVQDSSVSDSKKQKLISSRGEGDAAFVAAVITFALSRPFVARDIRKPDNNQNAAKSPLIRDYIFDADAPKPCRNFCGRDAEIAALHEALRKNGKVFLQGIPGIGKSEIAKAYAKLYKKEYTNILYFIYSGSLKRDIANLQFADDKDKDDEKERFHRHNRFLRTLKEDTLLIIDNFNTTAADEDLLPIVMKYPCKILFTTKSNFSDRSCVTVEEIADRDALYNLFSALYHDADRHRQTVGEIMETVYYHTLSVELAARLAQCGLLMPEEILSKLREERAAFNGTDEIKIDKDGQNVKATYYQHIRTLFALFQLEKPQSYTMQCMSLMPLSGIPARLFTKWLGFRDMNIINELEERGFLRASDDRTLSLHPMMQEVTVADLKPSVDSCMTMLCNLGNYCNDRGRNMPYSHAIMQIAENMIRDIRVDNPNFYIRLLELLFTSTMDVSRPKDSYFLIDEIERLLKDESVGEAEDRAHLLEYKSDMENTAEKKIPILEKAIAMYPEPTEYTAVDLYKLHAKLSDIYRRKRKYPPAFRHLKTAVDLSNQFPGHENDNRQLVIGLASLLNDMGQVQEALQVITPLEELLRNARMAQTYEYAAVLRKLAGITANCGDTEQGLAILDKAWSLYQFLCGEDQQRLQHFAVFINEIRRGILFMREHPGAKIGGF